MPKAIRLAEPNQVKPHTVTFGVCATSDPRIDRSSRVRCVNIVSMAADVLADRLRMCEGGPAGTPVNVVWSPVLIDGE